MRVGDIITLKNRLPKLSKILMRNIGWEYFYTDYKILAILGDVLVIIQDPGEKPQLVTKKMWEKLKKTGRNWEDD